MSSQPSPATSEGGEISLAWYAAALVVYMVGGYFFQSVLLNWIVGPLFLLIVLYVIPTTVRAVLRNMRRRPQP